MRRTRRAHPRGSWAGGVDGRGAGVTVMVPRFGGNLLLISRTTHPAVLINTNGWHGYGELKSGILKRVLDATNFATRLRSRRVGSERLFTPRNPL